MPESLTSIILEFQIEDTPRLKLTQLKLSIRIIFIWSFTLQNARYQFPQRLGLTAEALAQTLMPFLSRVIFFEPFLLFGTWE